MSFRELLSHEYYDTFVKLKHNDAIVATWYQAVINPLNGMTQDANALMWLVQMLCESKNAAYDQLLHRARTEVPPRIIEVDEVFFLIVTDRPETVSKIEHDPTKPEFWAHEQPDFSDL